MTRNKKKLRALTFYLPQFHPIPENDKWWGKGFTEWINTAKAKPLFKGHYQPHLPADLGFYDLRCPEVREEQAKLAKDYGIYGFCYYHYWFNGRRILERPFNEVLSSGKPDFPFCLCWANENWTKKWDGLENNILLKQDYSEEDDIKHINYLCENVFNDKRYIKVNDKPLFLTYNIGKLPDAEKTFSTWREEAKKYGLYLYLCRVESFPQEHNDPYQFGLDAAVEFQPDWGCLGKQLRNNCSWKILRKLGLSNQAYGKQIISEYSDLVENSMKKETAPYKRYPCVTPMWDNSPRTSENGVILRNSTPDIFKKWLTHVLKKFRPFSKEENFIFINAWNEWAEGNHLEPDVKFGKAYLEAVRQALSTDSPSSCDLAGD
ncbi:MAG: glycoside hydrolase family 99-like domain-containing protein [Candidatus Aminicenantes bacterium]|nr:glycoside hydrolase family 99-like domain-containing protein [Candidatus Aminicenantes bacterium]